MDCSFTMHLCNLYYSQTPTRLIANMDEDHRIEQKKALGERVIRDGSTKFHKGTQFHMKK